MNPFVDRLDAACEGVASPALLGIDPHLKLLPEPYNVAADDGADRAERAAALQQFCFELIDVAEGRVAAVKPQSAFFELLGADGVSAWEAVVARARAAGLLVVGDIKRSDIASTASAYAESFLSGPHACDAITINPYLGEDAVQPFLDVAAEESAGLFVLVRTSNPGSGLFQLHGEPPLNEVVAREVDRWGAAEQLRGSSGWSSVGAVVGATHPLELGRLRETMPTTPFLIPGYGAQGGAARDITSAFSDKRAPWRGALVNSSRGIAFASRQTQYAGRHWKDAAVSALEDMNNELREALNISPGG